jgi:hypothetical protein
MIIWNSDKANSASPCYRKPDADSLYQAEQAMLKHLEMFLKANGYDFDSLDVDVDRELLNRAFVRVDKRLDYYRIYHNDTYLNEVREAAVIAYWLIKYRPIRVISSDGTGDGPFTRLNENFALFVILSVIEGHREHLGLPVFSVDKFTIEQLKYGVRNWDLSKEALMLVAVALSDTTTTDAKQEVETS